MTAWRAVMAEMVWLRLRSRRNKSRRKVVGHTAVDRTKLEARGLLWKIFQKAKAGLRYTWPPSAPRKFYYWQVSKSWKHPPWAPPRRIFISFISENILPYTVGNPDTYTRYFGHARICTRGYSRIKPDGNFLNGSHRRKITSAANKLFSFFLKLQYYSSLMKTSSTGPIRKKNNSVVK